MKKYFRFLFVATLLFSVFSFVGVFADGNQLSLSNISVKDKSTSVGISKLKATNGEVDNNMFFNKVGDYINYDVVINNNSDKNYTIRDITSDSDNQYITYDYSNYKDKVIESGKSVTLNIKATYTNQAPTKVLSNTPVNFSILYDDGTGVLNTLNVNTGDHILGYVILFILSVGGLVLTIVYDRKHVTSYLVLLLSIGVLIPITTKADSHYLTFKIKNDISSMNVSQLKRGRAINEAIIYSITGDNVHWVYCDYWGGYEPVTNDTLGDTTDDVDAFYNSIYNFSYNGTSIVNATKEDFDLVKTSLSDYNVISTNESSIPTYVWSNSDTIYFYTDADVMMLNQDCILTFSRFFNISSIDLSKFNSSNVTNMSLMFEGCENLTSVDFSNFDTYNVTDMSSMFSGCINVVNLDLSNFNTGKVTNMVNMFDDCEKLVNLNVTNFDTSNVTNMSYMFINCQSILELDLSSFNTKNVVTMECMFCCCYSVNHIYLQNFDTSNVTSMYDMFDSCMELDSLDVSSFNTSKVTDMSRMFDCIGVRELDLSNFDTSNVTTMYWMFHNSFYLVNLDISNFDTSNVRNMERMFDNCSSLVELDVSSFSLMNQNVSVYMMFGECENLTTIYASDRFQLDSTLNNLVFYGDNSLVGGAGTIYNKNATNDSYARIDGGVDNPGYFTRKV